MLTVSKCSNYLIRSQSLNAAPTQNVNSYKLWLHSFCSSRTLSAAIHSVLRASYKMRNIFRGEDKIICITKQKKNSVAVRAHQNPTFPLNVVFKVQPFALWSRRILFTERLDARGAALYHFVVIIASWCATNPIAGCCWYYCNWVIV